MKDDSSTGEGAPLEAPGYRLISKLGGGAAGDVYDAEDKLGARVAIKFLKDPSGNTLDLLAEERAQARFRAEAHVCAQLDHPNVVRVRDYGVTARGQPFLVSERLVGRTLGDELRARGPLPVDEALGVARRILLGLSAAHARDVVHRDVKPDNVFLTDAPPRGERGVKVLDFGLAKICGGSLLPERVQTRTGTSLGTARYMSPEQALGRKTVDQRADLYSVGAVLWAMLVGRDPFNHYQDPYELMTAQVKEQPAPPSLRSKQPISGDVDRVVLKALAKDPAHRFQDALEFVDALDGVARLAAAAPAATAPPVPAAPAAERRWDATEEIATVRQPGRGAPPPAKAQRGTEIMPPDAEAELRAKGRAFRDMLATKEAPTQAPAAPKTKRGTEIMPADAEAELREKGRAFRGMLAGGAYPPTVELPEEVAQTARGSRPSMDPTLRDGSLPVSSTPGAPPVVRASQQPVLLWIAILTMLGLGIIGAIAILRS